LAALSLVAAATSACGGPKPSLSFGGKSVPVNVSFGKPSPDDPRAPDVPFVLAPVLGGVGVVPVAEPVRKRNGTAPVFEDPLPVPQPVVACPVDDQVTPPKLEATRTLGGAPPAGDYTYRIDGVVEGKSVVGSFSRRVQDSSATPDGQVMFKLVSDVLGVKTTATYQSSPTNGRVPGSVGLKAVSATGRGIDAQPSFNAPKPVTLLSLDATVGATWTDTTVDPLSATTFTVNGKVLAKSKVWACTGHIDAWQVVISQDVDTPLQQVHSEITDWIATQYGGLIVQESVVWHGKAGADDVAGQYTATINQVPGG
ncbi:MAG: hypothetical protein QOI20_1469, partial [Acidimicrobiaceae bacterium]|jgi:hypothetical protein|nr:hypothetical protein [Acidimicrobiaceae bacterium]